MSVSTVVSIVPFPIVESKPGLFPWEYQIAPAEEGDISILHVQDARRPLFIDAERGSEHIFVASETVARALVFDYSIAKPCQEEGVCGPGLFFIPEEKTKKRIKEENVADLQRIGKLQRAWWKALVRLADDLWMRSHQINQISDLERAACRQMQLKRDWLDDSPDTVTKCPYCTTLISMAAIVCFACHLPIDMAKYKEVQARMAEPIQPLNRNVK
jgi:hypothetical protein